MDNDKLSMLLISYIKQKLEYASSIWSLQLKRSKEPTKNIKKRITKKIVKERTYREKSRVLKFFTTGEKMIGVTPDYNLPDFMSE